LRKVKQPKMHEKLSYLLIKGKRYLSMFQFE